MRFYVVAALSMALASGPALAIGAGDKLPPDRPPSTMTPTEIRAYNAGLAPDHAYFIKCRKTEVIGSLARKLRVCRTNEQWKAASAAGNENAADTLEAMRRAPISGNN